MWQKVPLPKYDDLQITINIVNFKILFEDSSCVHKENMFNFTI